MTDHQTADDERAQHDGRANGADDAAGERGGDGRFGASRRRFMQTAAAGVGATGVAASASAQSSGSQQDGPGQQIGTPKLEVDGNVLVDQNGNTVTLRGLNVADPKLLNVTAQQRGKNAEQAIRYLTNRDEGWHPRVIRLPIEPGNVAEMAPVPVGEYEYYPVGEFDESDLEAYCENHLDDVIDLCAERNVYAIVDYHRHWGDGSLEWDGNDALSEEVELFWDFVAERYGDRDHVIFELYNEPTQPGMWGDPKNDHWAGTWFDWVNTAQPWLDAIREHTDTVVIIGSPGWTSSPEGALLTPETTPDYMQEDFVQFEDPEDNIGFTYHIYPKHDASKQQAWDDPSVNGEGVDEVYEEYPLFVTEFGWDGELQGTHNYSDPFFPLEGTTSGFGEPFMEWMESSDAINWTAWCADPIWKPVMIERPFTERTQHDDEDAIGDPYGEDLPVYCEEPPCEWAVLGEDVGDYDQKAGGFIRETLEDLKDDNVPEPGELEPPTSPSDQWTNEVTATTIEVGWESVADATSYNVYLDGVERDSTSSTTYTFDGLQPDTEYTIGVESANAEGTSAVEETTVVTAEDGGTGGPCEDVPTETVDGQTVCDVNGDGYFRDVNGDGEVGQDDVVGFFEVQHRDAWKQDAFDFSGNGEVNQFDVTELFDYVLTN